jgi:hypothetical protein
MASISTTRAGVFICAFNKGIALLSDEGKTLILTCVPGDGIDVVRAGKRVAIAGAAEYVDKLTVKYGAEVAGKSSPRFR